MKELAELNIEKSVNDFTFKLFRYFRLEEFKMQEILQSRDPLNRLQELYQLTLAIESKH